ncbi:MAG TPA: NADH-ubiquinone oxidoreductase-F iron-sulfur binding region domain-containing protein [Acidimicrobiia bacterium]|nr:NADH-ubiquinone oxidoreductase-F iron-sulfur binding region domain-containing protein [Acidimicrobiia bacterium]
MNWLLPNQPFQTLDEYLEHGGGQALPAVRERGAEWALAELDRSGLRGRGGAGFPTGRKWRSVLSGGAELGDRFVVVNGAEGEPGTFKDRPLLRSNPYQVIEGLAIAATVLDAREAFIAVKRSFAPEIEALQRALPEMADAGLLCDAPVTLVAGPEEYLFGEEKALLEVIEGNDPMPRWLPPYLHGLFATTPQEGWSGTDRPDTNDVIGANPTLVNNAETFANVPLILARGADWYRTIGTAETTGPLLCTVVGDVRHPSYAEIEPGLTVREVIERVGGGPQPGHSVKAVLSGFSNPVLTEKELDTPVTYEDLATAGGGLGSAGFIVYDDTRSMLSVARMVSRFLYVESCGQCRSCKLGCGEITRRLDSIAAGGGEELDFEIIGQRLLDVTSATRCFLAEEEQRVISSLLRRFPEDFADAVSIETLPVPKIVDVRNGSATYDVKQQHKRPDWTFAPEAAPAESVGSS